MRFSILGFLVLVFPLGCPTAPLDDAGAADAGSPDAGSLDAGSPDAGSPDAGSPDAGSPDAGSPDAGSPDAGSPDAGSPDAGSLDAGSPDAGTADAGTLSSCNKSANLASITKPTGVYTSVLTPGAVSSPVIRGGLIRATWAELEPSPGVYDFSAIESRLALLPAGQHWSLGIHGGWASVDQNDPELYDDNVTFPNGDPRPTIPLQMSPPWLVSTTGAVPFETEFRQVTVYLPRYWDPLVQTRLQLLLDAVAQEYASDSRLQLVYVPQMTLNGIEGHFNGVSENTLIAAAGIDINAADAAQQFEDIWVQASLSTTKDVAAAFPSQAIAFEVHDVIGRTSIPQRIMDAFLSDPEFEHRVGIGMWWISGSDTSYQPALVEAIRAYEGDLYGQVIGRSNEPGRFENGDYGEVFRQAKSLCMRYIEPWNYEFENDTHDALMEDFNAFSAATFE